MESIRQFIFSFLDFFYPIFRPFMKKQIYYYIACGGGSTLLGLFIYFYIYHYALNKQELNIFFLTFKPHIATLFITTLITFPIGFFLTKYIVWSDSNIPGKKQLFRHFTFVILSTFLNYWMLKLFVEVFQWWAMPSQIITITFIVILSYLTQKYISFKKV